MLKGFRFPNIIISKLNSTQQPYSHHTTTDHPTPSIQSFFFVASEYGGGGAADCEYAGAAPPGGM